MENLQWRTHHRCFPVIFAYVFLSETTASVCCACIIMVALENSPGFSSYNKKIACFVDYSVLFAHTKSKIIRGSHQDKQISLQKSFSVEYS